MWLWRCMLSSRVHVVGRWLAKSPPVVHSWGSKPLGRGMLQIRPNVAAITLICWSISDHAYDEEMYQLLTPGLLIAPLPSDAPTDHLGPCSKDWIFWIEPAAR